MAKIKTVTVKSASNISHPNPNGNSKLNFTQLKSEVELTAELTTKDKVEEVFVDLKTIADDLCKQHLTDQYNSALERSKSNG